MLELILGFMFLAMFIGGVYGWRRTVFANPIGLRKFELRRRIESPIGLQDVLILFGCFVVFSTTVTGIGGFLFGGIEKLLEPENQSWGALFSGTGILLGTAAGMAIIGIRHGNALRIFGWQPENLKPDIRIGLLSFVMVIPIVIALQGMLVNWLEYSHPTMKAVSDHQNLFSISTAWFSAVLVAPVCEEIFFRGTLQAWLQRIDAGIKKNFHLTVSGGYDSAGKMTPSHEFQPKFVEHDGAGSWIPVFVSAFVFSLAHLTQGPAPITLFVFGCALGVLYRYTGSIVPCIILHIGLNMFSMFWFTLSLFVEI